MSVAPASVREGARRWRAARRAWVAAALVGISVFAASTLLQGGMGLDDFFNRYWYNALILLATLAAVARAATARSERGAWDAFAIGIASWAVGEILFDFAYGGNPPYPSVADAFYLAFYPACYVGMLMLVRYRVSEFGRMVWLDGVTTAIAAAALGSAVLFEAVLRDTEGSRSVIVTNLAYPLGDILLLSVVVGVFTLTGWRPDRTWALIGTALAISTVADAAFLFLTAAGDYREGTILDALWPASMLLLGAAVWQQPRPAEVTLVGRPLLATSVVCGAIGLLILVYDHFHRVNFLALCLAGATIAAVTVRMGLTFRENARIFGLLRLQAVTDTLTGLGNRRRLVEDLECALADGDDTLPLVLAMYDLDGFKLYNDSFGHPAGDSLLSRLASALSEVVGPYGSCYRLGGDEFCVLARLPSTEFQEAFLEATAIALSESGQGFTVTSSLGAVRLPEEASNATQALRLADRRLYVQKRSRVRRRERPHEMLLQALYERSPRLRDHVGEVLVAATALGRTFGLRGDDLEELRLAARLHDVGKLAIPDDILQKPGPLDVDEWAFVEQHTVMGERILVASPGWGGVGEVVRATHERWDGTGYPDGLADTEIPLASRIIAVCDAFSAMISQRPYRLPIAREQALAELRRGAGTQFDPEVVEAFCVLEERRANDLRRGAA
jgi:two-component system cell cycle response regulator